MRSELFAIQREIDLAYTLAAAAELALRFLINRGELTMEATSIGKVTLDQVIDNQLRRRQERGAVRRSIARIEKLLRGDGLDDITRSELRTDYIALTRVLCYMMGGD